MEKILSFVLRLEKAVYFLTGLQLPTLRAYWDYSRKRIQYELDAERRAKIEVQKQAFKMAAGILAERWAL